jgi:hypothetical protein
MLKKFISILFLLSPLIISQSDSTLILSEIMFYPQTGPNEFVELYNSSETNSIDLNGYKIKYYTSNPDIIIDAGEGTILPPKSFAIILEGDYPFGSGIYDGLIPPEALVVKISDNAFGTNGMANTENRPVWLLNAANDTLEAYIYSANNLQGRSDEKIIMIKDSSQSNWANAFVANGTPGFTNSVTPVQFDLQMAALTFQPSNPTEGDDVTVLAKVKNLGTDAADIYSIEIYNDVNFDSTADPGEIFFSQQYANLASGDSIIASTIMNSLPSGNYQIISKVIFNLDEKPDNNQLIKTFIVFPPGNNYNDIVINEIMYAPSTGEPEWVELFNRTAAPINLKQWKFSDAATTVTITNSDKYIPENSYIVLARDSSILNFYNVGSEIIVFNLPALNNTGDAVVIKDSLGVKIDSLSYLPSWGGNTGGRSLERISTEEISTDPSNWGTSKNLNKATPGFINSLTKKDFDIAVDDILFNPQFPIQGDTILISAKVKNLGKNDANFSLQLFEDTNLDSIPDVLLENLQTLFLTADDSGVFNFNYSLENIQTQRGFFVNAVFELDQDTSNNKSYKTIAPGTPPRSVVINEIMYAPSTGEPEWVELYNRTTSPINLKQWKFSDAATTVTITNSEFEILPNSFIVLARDSSILNFYNVGSEIIVFNLPALNNTGDAVVIRDSLGVIIDSLSYLSSWGGSTGGRSLERISAEEISTDPSNWGTSNSVFKATPGLINSLTQKDFDIAVDDILFDPEFPIKGDSVSISTKVKNPGKNDANFSLQLFEDTDLDSIPDMLLENLQSLFLAAGDSGIFNFNYSIENIQSRRGFFINAVYNPDQDTTNNKLYKTIEPGLPSQSIVINEIMYAPAGGEPEWIELFNRTNDTINLKGWKVSDVLTTPATVTITQDVFIEPNSYLILSRSETIFDFHRFIPSEVFVLSLPVLNNDIDGVVLKDNRGLQMDSVFYSNLWGGTNGYSLERLSVNAGSNLPANWGTSFDIEQSTPGRINSLTPKQFDLSVAGMNFNPRFPVVGDDVFVSAFVRNNGSSDAINFSVEFYIDTDSNNVVDQLLSTEAGLNLAAGDSANIVSTFPIQSLTGRVLTAVRIVYSADEDTLNNYFEKSVEPGFPAGIVLINEVMYNTETNKPEWVELVNVSGDSINIKNWSISDVLITPTKSFITNTDVILQPDEYIVIAKDTSFNSAHPGVTAKVFFSNFGTLGNTSDGVVIYDFRNGIIDSLFYQSSWGGGRGLSLERISLEEATNERTNWTTSLSPKGSTPGEPNSILNLPDYKRNDLIINEIMFDPGTDNSEFVEFLNLSGDSINVGGWEIVDQNGNKYRLSQISMMIPNSSFFLLAADSLVVSKYGLDESYLKTIVGVSSLGLVNTGELILLRDVKGNVIDSVWYSNKWHNDNFSSTKNISLERINPNLGANDPGNWSSSVTLIGATPGNQNSIYTVNPNIESNISVSPNPFSPDNDGFEDFTIINYKLTQATSQVRIKIFDNKGRLVRTLANNQASGSSGSIIFDGIGDDGHTLRIGIYIIFLEAINEGSGVVESLKTVVVVARKL